MTSVTDVLAMVRTEHVLAASGAAGMATSSRPDDLRRTYKQLCDALCEYRFVRTRPRTKCSRMTLEKQLEQLAADKDDKLLREVPLSGIGFQIGRKVTNDGLLPIPAPTGTVFSTNEYTNSTFARPSTVTGDDLVEGFLKTLPAHVVQCQGLGALALDGAITSACKHEARAILVLIPVAHSGKKNPKYLSKEMKMALAGHQKPVDMARVKQLDVIGVPVSSQTGPASAQCLEDWFRLSVPSAIEGMWKKVTDAIANPVISVILARGQALPLTTLLLLFETLSNLKSEYLQMGRPPTVHIQLLADTHDYFIKPGDQHFYPIATRRNSSVPRSHMSDPYLHKLAMQIARQDPITSSSGVVEPFRIPLWTPSPSGAAPGAAPGLVSCIRYFVHMGCALCCEQARLDFGDAVYKNRASVWRIGPGPVARPQPAVKRKRPRASPKQAAARRRNTTTLTATSNKNPYVSAKKKNDNLLEEMAARETAVREEAHAPEDKSTLNDKLQRMALSVSILPSVSVIEQEICILLVPQCRDSTTNGRRDASVLVAIVIYMLLVRYGRGASKCGTVPRVYVIGNMCHVVSLGAAWRRQEGNIELGGDGHCV